MRAFEDVYCGDHGAGRVTHFDEEAGVGVEGGTAVFAVEEPAGDGVAFLKDAFGVLGFLEGCAAALVAFLFAVEVVAFSGEGADRVLVAFQET